MSSISSDVKAAEEMLKALGYNPGKVDGFFDQDTEAAVKEFQKKNNLKETGVLQGETTLQLMNQLREDIVKNDTQVKKAISILKK
jgi:carboxyl-terminal processing protease